MGIASSVVEQENSRKCTTPPITRILPKKFDPRSPTEGIFRSPIEVCCTPKSKHVKLFGTVSTSDTPTNGRVDSASDIVKKLNIDCVEQGSETLLVATEEVALDDRKEDKDFVSDENEDHVELVSVNSKVNDVGTELNPPPKKTMYLETDIDAIDDNFLNNLYIEHPRVKQLKSKISNTSAAQNDFSTNTSMEVQHSDTLSSRIDGMSFSDMPSFNDISLMVSDIEESSSTAYGNNVSNPAIQDWLITIEDNCDSLLPFDVLSSEDVSCIKMKNSENRDCKNNSFSDSFTKNICRTPDRQKNQSPNIVRTPLGCLVQNKICEPSKDSSCLKQKQWRGIQEERQRRGLSLGEENTPPLAPPNDKVWSAPGKLTRRKNIVEWDQDNATVLI